MSFSQSRCKAFSNLAQKLTVAALFASFAMVAALLVLP